MKAILLMFDSLNRHMLPPYGCDWTHAPNFKRLADKTVTFDCSYVGSMPCMPARRELHTGRLNFLHRAWGPLEPFDDSMPRMLSQKKIYTHLSSDHYHYWEDGGCTYHTRYNSWQFHRGQEGDPWIGQVRDPEIPPNLSGRGGDRWRQDWVNREFMRRQEDQPQAKTMAESLDFLRRNHDEDNWFLHIETFDPHEPFFTQKKFKDFYKHEYHGPHFDWPMYGFVKEPPEAVKHCRLEYAALLSMCDEYVGKVLDAMDELDLWQDTMLIVNTDHGFMLSEHDSWAKCWLPFYEEISHTPLFIWDPTSGVRGQRRKSLVQTIDLPVTLLDYFGVPATADMLGRSLRRTVADDTPVREAALFGIHGGQVNVTDGRYVYMRGPAREDNRPLAQYTHMPTHMRGFFNVDELKNISLAEPFSFTKGLKTMRIDYPAAKKAPIIEQLNRDPNIRKTLLFDLQNDPQQKSPIQDAKVEKRMTDHLVRLMKENDAPREQYERLGLKA